MLENESFRDLIGIDFSNETIGIEAVLLLDELCLTPGPEWTKTHAILTNYESLPAFEQQVRLEEVAEFEEILHSGMHVQRLDSYADFSTVAKDRISRAAKSAGADLLAIAELRRGAKGIYISGVGYKIVD